VGSIRGVSVTAQASIERPDSLIGQVLDDRYRVDRLIGKGGMGSVYLAEHVMLRRKVAIKTLHPGLSTTSELITRFHHEALAAAAIGNAHVVSVTDMGRLPNGVFYSVLEYLEGADLAWVLASQGPLSVARTLHLALQLCEALSAVHAAGIVHRDLKPENLFLIERDQQADFLKILDFGICKFHDRSAAGPRLTETGVAIGTPHFMAPEQIEASSKLDHRADLYAVGAIVFFMLTGRAPFDAGSVLGLFNRICREPPPDLATERTDVSPALAAIVTRALAKRPDDRFADAAQLAAALDPLRAGAPIEPSGPCKSYGPTVRVRVRPSPQPLAADALATTNEPARSSLQPTAAGAVAARSRDSGQESRANTLRDANPMPARGGADRQPMAANAGAAQPVGEANSSAARQGVEATLPATPAFRDSVAIVPGRIRWVRRAVLAGALGASVVVGFVAWNAWESGAPTQSQRMAAGAIQPSAPQQLAPGLLELRTAARTEASAAEVASPRSGRSLDVAVGSGRGGSTGSIVQPSAARRVPPQPLAAPGGATAAGGSNRVLLTEAPGREDEGKPARKLLESSMPRMGAQTRTSSATRPAAQVNLPPLAAGRARPAASSVASVALPPLAAGAGRPNSLAKVSTAGLASVTSGDRASTTALAEATTTGSDRATAVTPANQASSGTAGVTGVLDDSAAPPAPRAYQPSARGIIHVFDGKR
jgi:serine/threonine protein kinase